MNTKKIVIIIVGFVVAIALGVIGYFYLSRPAINDISNTVVQQPTTAKITTTSGTQGEATTVEPSSLDNTTNQTTVIGTKTSYKENLITTTKNKTEKNNTTKINITKKTKAQKTTKTTKATTQIPTTHKGSTTTEREYSNLY